MDTRTDLLAAVARAPADDTPRLMFADYLADTGDPRDAAWAEFIRIQIELAKTPARKTDPGAGVYLRPHGPRYWTHVCRTADDGTPPYAPGDRVDFDSRHNSAGKRVKPKHGLLVTKVLDVNAAARVCTVVLHEDAGSVPDPTVSFRERAIELWAVHRLNWSLPVIRATQLLAVQEDADWPNVAVQTEAPTGFIHPMNRPGHVTYWSVLRGFPSNVRVPTLDDLRADGWALAKRLAAVPGVRRVVPADRVPRPAETWAAETGRLYPGWWPNRQTVADGDQEIEYEPEVIGDELWAVVAADPRRVDHSGVGGNWADFPDRATADDALARGVCNLTRAKIGLPPVD